MIPRMPRWQSYVATTTQPIFTPEQCKMIIDAGHQCAPEQAKTRKRQKQTERTTMISRASSAHLLLPRDAWRSPHFFIVVPGDHN